MTSGDLTGRVAIVTGAAQGVGEATAHALAKRGATLVLTDVKADDVASTASDIGGEHTPTVVVADLADPTGPSQIVAQALEHTGQVDMLASVAGYAARGNILDTTIEQWDEAHALNLRAHFQLIQGVARHLVERDAPGSIAVAGSLNAYGGQPDLCAYSAAKGGLLTLVRHAAHALLPHRIRVNIVNFGWIHTQGEIDIQAEVHGNDEAALTEAAAALPFGRLIDPAEAGTLLTYLLSDDSSVMTGSAINFDQSVPGSGPTTAVRTDVLSPTAR